MSDIYHQLKNILRHEYVDITVTLSRLEEIEQETQKAGPEFEQFRLACINNLKNQHAIAIDYANRALKIAEAKQDLFLLEHLYTLLGFIDYNRGNFERCIEHYLTVLKYVQSPRIINNIGAIFDDLGDMHEAYRYYKQAEEVFDDPENFRLLAIIYSNIAECETAFGHYDEAKRLLELSQLQIQKHTQKVGATYSYNALGNLYYLQGDFDTAITYFEMGERFAQDEAILVYYQKFILNHAKALFAKGEYEAAKNRIDMLFENSAVHSFDSDVPEIHELLAQIADVQGNLEAANRHYRKYISLIRRRDDMSRNHRSESIKTAIKIAELHTQLATLTQMSKSDALTGFGNRYALRDYIESWAKFNSEYAVVIALFDVDHFKQHNDTFGHAYGDLCLVEISKIMQSLRQSETDVIFRYGGDEFILVLSSCDIEEATLRLETARLRIEALNTAQIAPNDAARTMISCSIGAVTVPKASGQNFQELFDMADRALYISKDLGRNCVTVLPSL